MTTEEYVKMQDLWIKATGVKEGTRVQVMREVKDYESGWNAVWAYEMRQALGSVYRVCGFRGPFGVRLEDVEGTICFNFPFFVLEPAEAPKPEKYEFKPFEQVLVRDSDNTFWSIELFDSNSESDLYRFRCLYTSWKRCIPYAGHEHLLGTTDEPEDWAKYYDKE